MAQVETAAQLNLVPSGTTPLLIASTRQATVTDWIGHSVAATGAAAPRVPSSHPRRSWLTTLTAGSGRLWVIATGVLVIFVGLLVDGRPAVVARAGNPAASPPRWRPQRPSATSEVEWSGNGQEEEEEEEEDPDEEVDEDEDDEDEEDDDEDDEEDDEEEEDDDEEDDEEEEDDDEEELDEEEIDEKDDELEEDEDDELEEDEEAEEDDDQEES